MVTPQIENAATGNFVLSGVAMLSKTPVPPLYLVEADFGRHGKAFVETDRDRNSRAQVIRNIVEGQVENVLKVLEIFEDEGTCRDVTEDIAREVLDYLNEQQNGIPAHLRDWLERHCQMEFA